MGTESRVIQLAARISQNNQLVLTFREGNKDVALRPTAGIWDLLQDVPSGSDVTLEVSEFSQDGRTYDVYGVVLAEDGSTVASHWEPTGRGQRYRFVAVSEEEARQVRLVIGATPRSPGSPVPTPFTSGQTPGGSAPIEEDGPKKGDE